MEMSLLIYASVSLINVLICIGCFFYCSIVIVLGYRVARVHLVLICYLSVATCAQPESVAFLHVILFYILYFGPVT